LAKILLSCSGVPPAAGAQAATDITAEFAEHRPWYHDVKCTWDGSKLLLAAESENDDDGIALTDEFSDCLTAYIVEQFDGDIRLEAINGAPSA
jgi:hypothetical protein